MCGICYVKRKDDRPAKKMIWKRYTSQKNRGTQGFGYIGIKENKLVSIGRHATEDGIEKILDTETLSNEILFHHRFPTSTPNFAEATHPIKVSNKLLDYDYYVVHNGVITNDSDLKEKWEEMGFEFTTNIKHEYITRETIYYENQFNDSESFAIDIALVLDGKKESIESEGNIAFIAIQVNKDTEEALATYYGRNVGNPLVRDDNKDFICITSEGNGRVITPDILFKIDATTGLTENKDLKIGKTYSTDYYSRTSYKYKEEDTKLDDYFKNKGKQTDFGFKGSDSGYVDDISEEEKYLNLYDEVLDKREEVLGFEMFGYCYGQLYNSTPVEDLTGDVYIKMIEENAFMEDCEEIYAINNNYDYCEVYSSVRDILQDRIAEIEEYISNNNFQKAIEMEDVDSYEDKDVGVVSRYATEVNEIADMAKNLLAERSEGTED